MIWAFFGALFWVLFAVLSRGNSLAAWRVARGLSRLILFTMVGSGVAFCQDWGERSVVAATLLLAFLFLGGALFNQWLWHLRLVREQSQEESGVGFTRAAK